MIISEHPLKQTRREFGALAALLSSSGLALLTPGMITANASAWDEPKLPDPKSIEEAIATIIKSRFGNVLTDEQITKLAKSVVRRRNGVEAIKKVPLSNSDDPFFAFRADLP